MGYVEAANGCGGMVMGLGGKEGRAGINVWGFQKVITEFSSEVEILANGMMISCRNKYCKD